MTFCGVRSTGRSSSANGVLQVLHARIWVRSQGLKDDCKMRLCLVRQAAAIFSTCPRGPCFPPLSLDRCNLLLCHGKKGAEPGSAEPHGAFPGRFCRGPSGASRARYRVPVSSPGVDASRRGNRKFLFPGNYRECATRQGNGGNSICCENISMPFTIHGFLDICSGSLDVGCILM